MAHHGAPPLAAAPIEAGSLELTSSDVMLEKLETRRSVPLRSFADDTIPADDLERMLTIAARTPDHGRLVPWRFIIVAGPARQTAGERLDALYASRNPDLAPAKQDMWTLYMLRAPVTVILVSRADPAAKIPVWDQELSAGAAGMNLLAAASALGYAAQWLLKWPGRDSEAAAIFGVGMSERVAGFIHLGRQIEKPQDRPRPNLAEVVTRWTG
ncbi:nitroreductase family protein [Mesorhizobium sp. BR1-1-16]|uniref:nitroreductase family protein n=1 Tax=Mesorhizobium sp. BR1-1-16 TaxID=2876653 RepID=UPI001CCA047D|nr:nitroreductase family protein [Mesorhizobium sp. BR1-1-16]MBZ9937900.1 nitroreductase family protein [Mesorhizobium sp. BR1-1-16]